MLEEGLVAEEHGGCLGGLGVYVDRGSMMELV